MADTVTTCLCGHRVDLHVPRGGSCTAASGGCDCRGYLPDEYLTPYDYDYADRAATTPEGPDAR